MHGKTEPILFGTNRRLKNLNFEIESGGQILKGKSSVKYLIMELLGSLRPISGSGQATNLIGKINNQVEISVQEHFWFWYGNENTFGFGFINSKVILTMRDAHGFQIFQTYSNNNIVWYLLNLIAT